jgi:Domain of unknown function (DUF3327)
MRTHHPLESPRLLAVQEAVASGKTDALALFWRDILEGGAPLIEALAGDERHALVTFVWREEGETHHVTIWGGPAGLEHPQDHQMTRLPGTDIWYKTYRLQTDLRAVYTFSVNDSLTDDGEGRAQAVIARWINSTDHVHDMYHHCSCRYSGGLLYTQESF